MSIDLKKLAAEVRASRNERARDSGEWLYNHASAIADALEELGRLKAALPKTADGVAIVPDMHVFPRSLYGRYSFPVWRFERDEENNAWMVSNEWVDWEYASDVYSTEAAALAALASQP